MQFQGKTAIVTGGGTGIGAAIVRGLAGRGARVCVVGRRATALNEVIAALPADSARACVADVSREADVKRVVEAALTFGDGHLDVVVNNAATSSTESVESISRQSWEQTLAVNLTGAMLMTREAIPHLRTSHGAVVNVASVGAFRPVPSSPAYCVSKAGMVMLTQQAALDYGPQGIRFNAVSPGRIRTPMGDGLLPPIMERDGVDLDGAYEIISRHTPLRRAGLPAEVANAVLFLASEEASFITGAALTVDGGSTLVNASGLAFLTDAPSSAV